MCCPLSEKKSFNGIEDLVSGGCQFGVLTGMIAIVIIAYTPIQFVQNLFSIFKNYIRPYLASFKKVCYISTFYLKIQLRYH